MPDADLYLGAIDYEGYFSSEDCTRCGAASCRALVEALRNGDGVHASVLGDGAVEAVEKTLNIERSLPVIPSLTTPRPVEAELLALNDPAPGDPVLVTGNSLFTQEVLLAVLATTSSPFFVLFADTRGDTLDMAVILESFTAERLAKAIEKEGLDRRATSSILVLPGLARGLKDEVAAATGFSVKVGPVCAAELPLFFGDRW